MGGGTRASRRSSVSSSSSSAVSWPFLFAADKPRYESRTVKTPGKATTLVSSHRSSGRSVMTVVVESSAPVKLWPFFVPAEGNSKKSKGYYESEPKKSKRKWSSPRELETQVFPFFAQEKRKVMFVRERDQY